MANKKRYSTGSKSAAQRKTTPPPRKGLLLALTLVPLVLGGLMILAWALDINIWDDPTTQIYIGVMFILGSFAASNALQRFWISAAGWTLLLVSDLLLLRFTNLALQVTAFVLGGAGLLLLGLEFYKRLRARGTSPAS